MKIKTRKIELFVKLVTIKKKKNDYKTLIQESKIDKVNKKIIIPEKQKHDNKSNVSAYENHRHVFIDP